MAKDKEVKIVPLGDRVLIRPFKEEEVKSVGKFKIILPESATKERSDQGKILAVGEGKMVEGKIQPIRVKVGETVIFSKYGYDEVKQGDEELYLVREENILAIVK